MFVLLVSFVCFVTSSQSAPAAGLNFLDQATLDFFRDVDPDKVHHNAASQFAPKPEVPKQSIPQIQLSKINTSWGLLSLETKEIIPTKYSAMEYQGNGLYMALSQHDVDEAGRPIRHLFTQNGKEIKSGVPQGTKFMDIYSLGESLDNDLRRKVTSLPKGAIIRFYTPDLQMGLCTRDGKTLLPAQLGVICYRTAGSAYISNKHDNTNQPDQVVTLSTGQCVDVDSKSAPGKRTTRLDKYAFQHPCDSVSHNCFRSWNNFEGLKGIERHDNRVIVEVESEKFDPLSWKESKQMRKSLFRLFLRNYNLIGMQSDQVAKLLGLEQVVYENYQGALKLARYHFETSTQLSLNFANDRVVSWYFTGSNGTKSETFKKNMLIETWPKPKSGIVPQPTEYMSAVLIEKYPNVPIIETSVAPRRPHEDLNCTYRHHLLGSLIHSQCVFRNK